jgi:hypothetical protein
MSLSDKYHKFRCRNITFTLNVSTPFSDCPELTIISYRKRISKRYILLRHPILCGEADKRNTIPEHSSLCSSSSPCLCDVSLNLTHLIPTEPLIFCQTANFPKISRLIRHHTMEMYGGVEVELYAFLMP